MPTNSFGNCGGPYDLSPEHSISNWESKTTTCAEQAVIRYLAELPDRRRGRSLLHVGIGNGALFAAIGAELGAFTGITISRPELECFKQKFADPDNAITMLANKHDDRIFESIGDGFDIIVDVNLKSYACCEMHFHKTMTYYARALASGGMLITAQSGLDFGWAGNTAIAYTPGADASPSMTAYRILGSRGLEQLAKQLGLVADKAAVPVSAGCAAETLWILRKE